MPLAHTRGADHQRFDWSALFAQVAVNLEIDVQRMRLDLRERGLDAANRTRVFGLELQRYALDTHVLSLPAGYFGAPAERVENVGWTVAVKPDLWRLFGLKCFARRCAALASLTV